MFIGILLSLLFIIFLTLVIYYKQITEGYNDRYNFEVMQKVGLLTEKRCPLLSIKCVLCFSYRYWLQLFI